METNIQSNANPTLHHLHAQVPDQAQPAPVAQPAGNQPAPLPALNQAGSLGEPVAPIGLRNRQVQQGYDVLSQSMWEAHQCLKKGNTEAAISIYTTLAEKPELDVKDRLSCAKKLLKIHTQATKAGDLLASIARDDRVDGPNRLKALRSLAASKGLEEKALEAFSALLQSQLLPEWIRDAAGDCIAPLLLAKAQDTQLWPLERIQAAKQLAQINGQVEKAAAAWASLAQHTEVMTVFVGDRIQAAENLSQIEGYKEKAAQLLIAIAERKNDYLAYRIKAAKILSELKGQEARTRGNELLDAFFMVDLVEGNLPKRIKHAQTLSKTPGAEARAAAAWLSIAKDPERYVSNRCYAAEMLSKIPGQEASAAVAWASIVEDTSSPAYPKAYAINEEVRLSYCIKAAEKLAEMKGTEHQALAVQTLEAIKNNVTLKLSYRIQAAEALSRITQGDELVDFLFELVKNLTVFPADRIAAAERLVTLNRKYSQGEIWSALIHERLTYIHPAYGMKVAEKLGQIPAYRACAAGYLLYLGRVMNNYITWRIQAFEKLSKIPGYEATAADFLFLSHQDFQRSNNNYDNKVYFNQWDTAEVISEIPGQEENAATVLVNITKGPLSSMLCFHHTGERLSKIPGQEEKSKEAWSYIANYKHSHPAMVSSRILAMRALFDLFGEKDKAAELLTQIAAGKDTDTAGKDVITSIEHRMLAVNHLASIPGKEMEAVHWKATLEEMLRVTKDKIEAAKNNLQIPDKKQEAANELLQIAKNPVQAFSDRMLAGDILTEFPEQHPKAIEAWIAINTCSLLIRYQQILALGKLSTISGQEQKARALMDRYMISINDVDKYFLV